MAEALGVGVGGSGVVVVVEAGGGLEGAFVERDGEQDREALLVMKYQVKCMLSKRAWRKKRR